MTEGRFAVATEPGMPPEQTAQILPVSPAQVTSTQQSSLAMVQPAYEPQAMLPETAGPLPWLAVTGLLSLLGGLGLTLGRKFSGSRL